MVDGRRRRWQEAAGGCKRLQEVAGSWSVCRMRVCVCGVCGRVRSGYGREYRGCAAEMKMSVVGLWGSKLR